MVPIWKQTMLTPIEYSEYANIPTKTIYELCNKKRLPCIKTAKGFKIHRVEADKRLAEMAMSYEGHADAGEKAEQQTRRRAK